MILTEDELFERDANRDFRCVICGKICSDRGRRGHGALGKVAHGRKHVRAGEAVEGYIESFPQTVAFRVVRRVT